eukprot:TRINITY_DN20096_c0_g1_i3.p1 TRINITY_DN20096_c0_g1~~TRINITY_DN20096_c0_g1_i3.p1  ORF type:complete len:578 (+),score=36.48 TRINITY_DN20096_c0_g1_i3:92-1825(+)
MPMSSARATPRRRPPQRQPSGGRRRTPDGAPQRCPTPASRQRCATPASCQASAADAERGGGPRQRRQPARQPSPSCSRRTRSPPAARQQAGDGTSTPTRAARGRRPSPVVLRPAQPPLLRLTSHAQRGAGRGARPSACPSSASPSRNATSPCSSHSRRCHPARPCWAALRVGAPAADSSAHPTPAAPGVVQPPRTLPSPWRPPVCADSPSGGASCFASPPRRLKYLTALVDAAPSRNRLLVLAAAEEFVSHAARAGMRRPVSPPRAAPAEPRARESADAPTASSPQRPSDPLSYRTGSRPLPSPRTRFRQPGGALRRSQSATAALLLEQEACLAGMAVAAVRVAAEGAGRQTPPTPVRRSASAAVPPSLLQTTAAVTVKRREKHEFNCYPGLPGFYRAGGPAVSTSEFGAPPGSARSRSRSAAFPAPTAVAAGCGGVAGRPAPPSQGGGGRPACNGVGAPPQPRIVGPRGAARTRGRGYLAPTTPERHRAADQHGSPDTEPADGPRRSRLVDILPPPSSPSPTQRNSEAMLNSSGVLLTTPPAHLAASGRSRSGTPGPARQESHASLYSEPIGIRDW